MSFPPGSGGTRVAPVLSNAFFAPVEIVSERSQSAFRPLAKSDRLQIEFLIGISPEP